MHFNSHLLALASKYSQDVVAYLDKAGMLGAHWATRLVDS